MLEIPRQLKIYWGKLQTGVGVAQREAKFESGGRTEKVVRTRLLEPEWVQEPQVPAMKLCNLFWLYWISILFWCNFPLVCHYFAHVQWKFYFLTLEVYGLLIFFVLQWLTVKRIPIVLKEIFKQCLNSVITNHVIIFKTLDTFTFGLNAFLYYEIDINPWGTAIKIYESKVMCFEVMVIRDGLMIISFHWQLDWI